jgi:ribosomal protein S13
MPLVIAKTVLPDAQKFYLALGRIFGIGRAQGLAIAEQVGISKEARVSDVKTNHVRQVCEAWEFHPKWLKVKSCEQAAG